MEDHSRMIQGTISFSVAVPIDKNIGLLRTGAVVDECKKQVLDHLEREISETPINESTVKWQEMRVPPLDVELTHE